MDTFSVDTDISFPFSQLCGCIAAVIGHTFQAKRETRILARDGDRWDLGDENGPQVSSLGKRIAGWLTWLISLIVIDS